jgi:hypothetical protein
MTRRLITFGDSWTAGDCSDLVEAGLVPADSPDVHKYFKYFGTTFKTPWPVILAKNLKFEVYNFGIPGNCNKSIVTQLYDYHLFNKFRKEDLVIVLFSTWHRDFVWKESFPFYNKICFEKSSSFYSTNPKAHLKDFLKQLPSFKKIAYDAFFDFYSAKQFLENLGVTFYIGWAFTEIDDFSEFLLKEYVNEIKGTETLINPFSRYCKIINFEKLMHPMLEDHYHYAKYLLRRIMNDKILK